jgi:hypothetical protein
MQNAERGIREGEVEKGSGKERNVKMESKKGNG